MAQEQFQELNLSEVMSERFGRYSKYIIQERAIPDVRDGLKPVQRRIIYAMYHEGNTYDKGYRKSAKTVGNVIGNYHPHGDSSVYDAMVRLSQDWKIREPLVDMQGNNGSMDGDPPAAMRYTEARLSKIANQLTGDLDKDTVDWILNFDDTEEEPTVLPARFPNLLVNGSTGISAGYATDIPPHNLGEVIDATIYLMDHPNAGLKKIMDFIKGPDFPTGAIIQGKEDLIKAYETGKGRVVVRAATQIEKIRGGRERIVIERIPYEVNKANLIQQIDDIRINRDIEGIQEVRDETDKDGLRIAIDLRKESSAEGILTYLLKNTDMQVNYNMNMVAINQKRPEQMGIIEMIQAYTDYRREVTMRRTKYLLRKAKDRQHIVEGLIHALSVLDEVIAIIRKSKNKKNAKDNLVKEFQFSQRQAEAIVSLQLYRLSNTDVNDLQAEAEKLAAEINSYELIVNDPKELDKVIKKELRETKKSFATPRRTTVEDEIEELEVDKEVLIADEDVIVTVTKEGYLKRTSIRSFAASEVDDFQIRDNDHPIFAEEMSTLDHIILFTNKGNAINRPVYALADIRWKTMGDHLSQEIALEDDEQIIAVFGLEEFNDEKKFVFATAQGYIKQTAADEFKPKKNFKSNSYKAINLKEDELIQVMLVDADRVLDVFAVTKEAYGLRYDLEEVSLVGPNARGVLSVDLKEEDQVTGTVLIDPFEEVQEILLLSQRGFIKKMNVSEFEKSARNRRGLKVYRSLKSNPHEAVLLIPVVDPVEEIIVTTSIGKEKTVRAKDYASADRQSNGSGLFEEGKDGTPKEFYRMPLEKLEED